MGNEELKCLTIVFRNRLHPDMIPKFRGAIIKRLEDEYGESDILFHNHDRDRFRWSYPLVQYKTINENAAIVCLNEAALGIGKLLSALDKPITIGRNRVFLEIDSIIPQGFTFAQQSEELTYSIKHWLPLNSINYRQFSTLERVGDKAIFLEKILTGNILSMAKGLDVHIPFELSCRISNLSHQRIVESKDVKMSAFDVGFKTNVLLPDYVGLGKHASTGFGIIKKQSR